MTLLEGHAEVLDAHTVAIDGRRITAKYILVAVGSWPTVPKFPGFRAAITSNESFLFAVVTPAQIVVVGGGYIGVEFAGIFHGLGAHTTQLYRGRFVSTRLRRRYS